jgi:anti-anti-sigma factor
MYVKSISHKECAMTNTIKMPKRFDYSVSSEFNTAFGEALNTVAAGQQIHIDCIHLDYIDSAGIGLLVMAHKKALAHNVSIVIVHAKPTIKEIFQLANLQKIIRIQ